jgi:hypothetical protein
MDPKVTRLTRDSFSLQSAQIKVIPFYRSVAMRIRLRLALALLGALLVTLPWYAPATSAARVPATDHSLAFCDSVSGIPKSECEALVALYNSTNGDGWWCKTGWLQTHTPCSWCGVTCANGRVVDLNLSRNGLTGTLPASLGNLTNLRGLWLQDNQLSGSIPSELSSLANLQGLVLQGNQLNGSIPPEIGNLANLTDLWLNENQFSGSIPPELGNLANLQGLSLQRNQLSGSIPPELGNLANLTALRLYSNQLSGGIPLQLGNLANLTDLWLYGNQLSGSLPAQLGNLTNLGLLILSNNALSGEIPLSITNLVRLQSAWTDLGYNALSSTSVTVTAFLDSKDPDWVATQTVPPTGVHVVGATADSLQVTWTPISYTQDSGYYEVGYAANPAGPYTVHGTTADKAMASYTVGGLAPGTTYHLRVRAYTVAHENQQNALWSAYTPPITGTTLLITLTPTATTTVTPSPSPTCTPTTTATLTPTPQQLWLPLVSK